MVTTIEWTGSTVRILDQTCLPGKIVYRELSNYNEVAEAIKKMRVRGAPLIGVVAAFGMALTAFNYKGPQDGLESEMSKAFNVLLKSRPTAVNLQWALQNIMKVYHSHIDIPVSNLRQLILDEAHSIYKKDIASNRAIGDYGKSLLRTDCRILTICNAGALATCGYGTALGVIRAGWAEGKVKQVWISETRPVLQGARLTAWEMCQDGIPSTLITDNMAGYIMQLGLVDIVIVGADRIAANGDTANKIGTYSLAVLARYHEIPFYVAAPLSTIDCKINTGKLIPVEMRSNDEIKKVGKIKIAPDEVNAFNPAFDITPAGLISGIITEKGFMLNSGGNSLKELIGRITSGA